MGITLEEINKKINENGLSGKVHVRDMLVGLKDPKTLNKIVDNKIGYKNAKTDAERGLYAAETKMLRAKQGYQLSDDGGRDITEQVLHGSGKTSSSGMTTADVIQMVEAKRAARNAARAGNTAAADSAGTTNAAFERYRETLEAAQKKAQEDALGKVSALTGGYGSSSAAMAATAAGADYSKLLADKELELAENERQRALAAEQQDYQRRLEKAQLAASVGDYSLYEQMGIDMTKLREKEKADAETAAAAAAETAAQKERSTYEQLLADAETAAKYGDTSKLQALGIDTSQYDSKFAGSATQKSSGSTTQKSTGRSGSSAKTVSTDFQTNPSAALLAAGAETFNQAYALLLSHGYSSTAAEKIAQSYLAELEDLGDSLGDAGNGTRKDSTEPDYTAQISKALNHSAAEARDLICRWVNAGEMTVDEAVVRAKRQQNALAYLLLRRLVADGTISAEQANTYADDYEIYVDAPVRETMREGNPKFNKEKRG